MATERTLNRSLETASAALERGDKESASAILNLVKELLASNPELAKGNAAAKLEGLVDRLKKKPAESRCEAKRSSSSGSRTIENFLTASTRTGSTLVFDGEDRDFALHRMGEIINSTFLDPYWTQSRPDQDANREVEAAAAKLNKLCPLLPKIVIVRGADAKAVEVWKSARKSRLPSNTSIAFAFPSGVPADVTFGKPTMQDKIEYYRAKIACHPEVRRKSDEELKQFLADRTFYEVDRGATRDIFDANDR